VYFSCTKAPLALQYANGVIRIAQPAHYLNIPSARPSTLLYFATFNNVLVAVRYLHPVIRAHLQNAKQQKQPAAQKFFTCGVFCFAFVLRNPALLNVGKFKYPVRCVKSSFK
jgi:hypothetical protein